MKERLKPFKVKTMESISAITGIAGKNMIGGINGSGIFTVITIDKNGMVFIKNPAGNFPGFQSFEIKSDCEYDYIWTTRGRGFYVLDIKNKKNGHCIASNNGDDKIVNTQLIDPDNKIFMIRFNRLGPGLSGIAGFIYVLYDLDQDKIIYESPLFGAYHYRLNDNNKFYCEISGEHHNILKWYLMDKDNNKTENKLTKKLTEMQIKVWSKGKSWDSTNRIMLGSSKIIDNTYFSIRWDEKFEDIKIEPIIIQRPDGNFMDEAFEFSKDGKWVKTLRFPFNNGRDYLSTELMIFHVSDIYPQGLSMPVLCGPMAESAQGAFMDHSEWGMCYVCLEDSHTLYVYKLNDGLKLIADDIQGMFKK